mgnify:CR=1 FL=1
MPMIGFFICSANLATKCSASSGTSSIRSRSDGSRIGIDVDPVEQVLAELPLGDHLARGRGSSPR